MDKIRHVEKVTVGSVDPNNPLDDAGRDKQLTFLNKCLNERPKGKIIGKDVTIGIFMIGEHQLSTEKVTYHIGFERRPYWMENTKTQ